MSSWKLSRKDNGVAVTLPQDMHWTDEFEWSAVAQTAPVHSLAEPVHYATPETDKEQYKMTVQLMTV